MSASAAQAFEEVEQEAGADALEGGPGWRLTVYFALLVAVVAVAAGAATVYVFVQTDRDSRNTAHENADFAAKAAAKNLAGGVTALRQTVASVAATPNIEQAAEDPSCTLSFSLAGLSRGHIDVIRPDGTVACSSRQRTGKAPLAGYAGAAWLKRAAGGPALVGPIVDTATGDRSVVAVAPTPGHAVVAAFLALEPVGRELADVYGGGRPVEFLIASAGRRTILTRSIDSKRWAGTTTAGAAFAPGTGRDLDGTRRIYEHANVPGTDWTFYAGEDEGAARAAGHRLRERQLLIILAGFLLVLLATLVVYRRVAVPIRRLGMHVRATSALTPPERVPVSGPAEITDLGNDINALISSADSELRQRERAEESALTSERNYRSLFESSPLPMWIHDRETHAILAANAAAVVRYGYSRDEFLALTAADILAPDAPPDDESAAHVGRSRHVRKDGREIQVRTIAHPVTFDGRPAECVVAEDVGERERLESQLRQAQKMEAVGQLAGGVAHDFNNLLTVISGYGGMARQRIGVGPGARDLDEIERAAARAAQLTQQLLAFSRQQVLEPIVLDLNEVIAAVTPMLMRLIGENVEIGVLTEENAPPVLADRGQIELVIVNLVVNARDAMPDGGTLTIETRGVHLDERYANEHAGVEPGEYACLSVTDTGTGIDRETQSRIFEPFFTTKDLGAGTGLGLATVHGIINQSGGHLEVYSEPGLGTNFKVYLPATAGRAVASVYAPKHRPEQLTGSETVLVCEDDELVRLLIETMLTENGYAVLTAARPREALRVAASHDGPIDVLVTDVVMPELSGPELVEQVVQVRPDVEVLFLSGYSADAMRGPALPANSAFLQKPFDDVALLQRIRGLLERTLDPR
ncbi:MAG: ATP-binding protein [Gaiellaceae bacterium]